MCTDTPQSPVNTQERRQSDGDTVGKESPQEEDLFPQTVYVSFKMDEDSVYIPPDEEVIRDKNMSK